MILPRLWIRQLAKLLGAVVLLTATVAFMDFYFNFLPKTVYHHLPMIVLADEVVVDVKIETCMTITGCLGMEKDGWYRLPKNIFLGRFWGKSGFLYAKRVKHENLGKDASFLMDVALGKDVPGPVLNDTGLARENALFKLDKAGKIASQEGSGVWTRKGELWLKHGNSEKYSTKQSITAVDVLFGIDAVDPRPAWSIRPGYLAAGAKSQPRLSLRLGLPETPKQPELRFRSNNKYKILQAADFHFSTGVGECLDPYPLESVQEPCEADPRTLEFFNQVLDQEKPDLVVFTGDQIFGDDAPDSISALFKVVQPLVDRKIPYAMVFGNHDHQGSMDREAMMQVIEKLPYSMAKAGDPEVDGVGNYLLTIDAPKSSHPALSLYFVDSHAHNPKAGYDFIHENQLLYLKKLHEGIKDDQNQYSHIPLSMAFFHIPLPEYVEPGHPFVGEAREGCTAPQYNSGTKDVLSEIGVSVVSVGHDHVNDYCMFHDGAKPIWLCYGGGAGEGAYGGYGGYIRRFRLFEIDGESGDITSWKIRRGDLDIQLDRQLLVQAGKAHYEKAES